MKIALYGASGAVGRRVAAEATSRDHRVTGITRTEAPELPDGVVARRGDALDADDVARVASEHDVIVCSIGPSRTGGRHAVYLEAIAILAENVSVKRLLVVGHAGSLELSPGLRLLDLPGIPDEDKAEALTHAAALDLLNGVSGLVDWVYISPAPVVEPGARTGRYRVGADTPVGERISFEDLAVAIVDELERPRHRRDRFTVAN